MSDYPSAVRTIMLMVQEERIMGVQQDVRHEVVGNNLSRCTRTMEVAGGQSDCRSRIGCDCPVNRLKGQYSRRDDINEKVYATCPDVATLPAFFGEGSFVPRMHNMFAN